MDSASPRPQFRAQSLCSFPIDDAPHSKPRRTPHFFTANTILTGNFVENGSWNVNLFCQLVDEVQPFDSRECNEGT